MERVKEKKTNKEEEGQPCLVDAVDDVLGGDEAAAAELVGLLEHLLGAGQQVHLAQRWQVDAGLLRRDLLQQVRVHLRADQKSINRRI